MVTIVGAGPSGSYLGYLLAKEGFKVNLLEEHSCIGKPVQCTGVVTDAIDNVLKLDESVIVNKIKTVRVHFNGDILDVDLGKGDYILDRCKFDRYLCEMAENEGVKVLLNHRLNAASIVNKKIQCLTNKGLIEDEILVGADGPYSRVGNSFNMLNGRKYKTAMQYRVKGEFEPDVYKVYLGYGEFGWLVPENKNFARIGVVGDSNLRKEFNKFLKLFKVKKLENQTGMIPLFNHDVPLSFKNKVFLTGDAAGLVKASSVDYSESIMIFEDGMMKSIRVGEFVNDLMNKNKSKIILEDKEIDLKSLKLDKRVDVFTLDKKGKLKLVRLNRVIKHRLKDNLYEVICEKGFRVKVTSAHSIMCLSNDEIIEKKTSELVTGQDYLLIRNNVPKLNSIKEINVIKLLLDYDKSLAKRILVFRGMKYLRHKRDLRFYLNGLPKTYYRRDLIPLEAFLDQGVIPEDVKITMNPAKKFLAIPNKIKINKYFARLLGYYVAEGSLKKSGIILNFGKDDILNGNLEDVKYCIERSLGIRYCISMVKNKFTKEDSKVNVVFGGFIVGLLFSRLLGCNFGSENKEVPNIIFNVSDSLRKEFLKAYFRGDGHLRIRKSKKRRNWSADLTVETASRKLVSDLVLLLFQLGVSPNVRTVIHKGHVLYGKNIKTTCNYVLSVSNQKDLYKLRDFFPEKRNVLTSFIRSINDSKSMKGIPKKLISDIFRNRKLLFRKYFGHSYSSFKTYSYEKMIRLLGKIKNKNKKEKLYFNLIKNNVLILPIKDVKIADSKYDEVFDLEVNDINTFVGGLGNILLHNTHGGIVYGLNAAKVLSKIIKDGGNYDKEIKRLIGKELLLSLKIRQVMSFFKEEDYSYLISLFNQERVLELMKEYNRDFPSKFLFKLLLKEPRFLKFLKFVAI
ncbi:NAD(P)-binding protein [Candidatus Woesearchaeota archaeon]|nr:NAD(P)-binding protein [Candidatus Woesearchaeota archaeon]